VLTIYDWIYGVAQLAAGFLAVIAGIICLTMLRSSRNATLRAWRPMLFGILLLIAGQIIGGLRTFGILPYTGVWSFIVHVLVSGILGMLICAILIQLQVNRGWLR
jgi:hypothetical protein